MDALPTVPPPYGGGHERWQKKVAERRISDFKSFLVCQARDTRDILAIVSFVLPQTLPTNCKPDGQKLLHRVQKFKCVFDGYIVLHVIIC